MFFSKIFKTIVKNHNYMENKSSSGSIKKYMDCIRINMTRDFKKEFAEKYDRNNTNHNKKINNMI